MMSRLRPWIELRLEVEVNLAKGTGDDQMLPMIFICRSNCGCSSQVEPKSMKRVMPWLLGVLSLVLLTACGQTVSDLKWTTGKNTKSITIGFDNTFVPMGFEQKDGSYAGFDIDLANQVFESYGIHVKATH